MYLQRCKKIYLQRVMHTMHPNYVLTTYLVEVPIPFCRFLNYLENEIYNSNSPIWHADFNQTPEALAVPSPAGSSKTPTPSPAAGPASNISKIGNHSSNQVHFGSPHLNHSILIVHKLLCYTVSPKLHYGIPRWGATGFFIGFNRICFVLLLCHHWLLVNRAVDYS